MKKKGFTIIEILVVITVIGLTLPVMFSIFFVLFQQQTKINRLSAVKKEGDYIISQVNNTVKDRAVSIHSGKPPDDTNKVCATDISDHGVSPTVTSLYFLDKNRLWFGYALNGNSIAFDSVSLASVQNLSSSKIIITNFLISCIRNNLFSPPLISLSFDICYDAGTGDCTSTRPEELVSLHYQTRIKLRNQ